MHLQHDIAAKDAMDLDYVEQRHDIGIGRRYVNIHRSYLKDISAAEHVAPLKAETSALISSQRRAAGKHGKAQSAVLLQQRSDLQINIIDRQDIAPALHCDRAILRASYRSLIIAKILEQRQTQSFKKESFVKVVLHCGENEAHSFSLYDKQTRNIIRLPEHPLAG